jgi:hypothetical protein
MTKPPPNWPFKYWNGQLVKPPKPPFNLPTAPDALF